MDFSRSLANVNSKIDCAVCVFVSVWSRYDDFDLF